MNFLIQLGHPKIHSIPSPCFERIKDVIHFIFRNDEESVYIFWCDIPIQLRYRSDLSTNFSSILAMVWLIQRDTTGKTKVSIENQLLVMVWELVWDTESLIVKSSFKPREALYARYASSLDNRSTIQVSKFLFLSEWKTLLHQIIVSFKSAEINIKNGTERRKWELMQQVEQQIPQYGQLYRKIS